MLGEAAGDAAHHAGHRSGPTPSPDDDHHGALLTGHLLEADGGGPVDATFKAIESIVGSGAELLLYSVNAITTGTDAQGEVTTRLSKGGRIVNGNGADTDIVIASARSYLNALNKLHSTLEKVRAQGDV